MVTVRMSRCMNRLMVVLPACSRDYELMVKNVAWQAELGGCAGFEAVIAHDHLLPLSKANALAKLAEPVYKEVRKFRYIAPKVPLWPNGPNVAFQSVAKQMVKYGAPWLWLEADAMPMKKDWLLVLEEMYVRAGKPFFGPIVPGAGHMNGVGIYPPDTPTRIPKAMLTKNLAWDAIMKPEMIKDCYDAGLLIQHCWGIWEGKMHPSAGNATKFTNGQHMDELLASAVVFHRCKDDSLIKELRKRRV